MKLSFVSLKSSNQDWLDDASYELCQKITRLINFEMKSLKSKNYPREKFELKIKDEEQQILDFLKSDDWVILFDEKGKVFADSVDFSKQLVRSIESGKQRIVFVLGGAFGVGAKIKERANQSFSLSSLTFNHHVAQLASLEQIYRALNIWKGIPYHNA